MRQRRKEAVHGGDDQPACADAHVVLAVCRVKQTKQHWRAVISIGPRAGELLHLQLHWAVGTLHLPSLVLRRPIRSKEFWVLLEKLQLEGHELEAPPRLLLDPLPKHVLELLFPVLGQVFVIGEPLRGRLPKRDAL